MVGPRRGRVAPRESPHRDRPRFGRRRRPRHRPGVGGQRGSEPSQPHRAVFGGNGEGAGAHARRARASFRRRGHRIGDRRHPHRASVGSAHSERASDLRDRRIRLGQDDARAGKPRRPRSTASRGRRDTARARASRVDAAGHRAGRTWSTPRPSASNVRSTVATLLRRAATSCAAPSRALPNAKAAGAESRRRSPTTPDRLRCPDLRRHGRRSPWTCSSCPTWTSPAPPAAAAATAGGRRHPDGLERRRLHRRR